MPHRSVSPAVLLAPSRTRARLEVELQVGRGLERVERLLQRGDEVVGVLDAT